VLFTLGIPPVRVVDGLLQPSGAQHRLEMPPARDRAQVLGTELVLGGGGGHVLRIDPQSPPRHRGLPQRSS
jgi:hypothetical protein